MFSDTPIAKEGYVIAITHTNAIAISLTDNPLTPVRWRVIDQYEDQIRSVVHVSTSDDARYALVGSSDGFVRVIDIKRGGCRFNLCLPECAEHIVANSKWVVAGNAFHPLTLNVWQLSDGACVDNYTASSMGWQSVLSIAGLTTTRHQDHFAIWNGRDCVRILDVKSGNFIRAIPVCCRFAKGMRSATEEAEHGAGAPLTGRKRMILLADGKTAAVATSNRVMIVSLDASQRLCTKQIQLDGARRALIEKSTDDRVVVTAESNAFGGLGTRVSGTASIASKSRLQVWKTDTGALSSEMTLPSPATSISVCGDIVAVVCGAVGQVMVVFAKRQ